MKKHLAYEVEIFRIIQQVFYHQRTFRTLPSRGDKPGGTPGFLNRTSNSKKRRAVEALVDRITVKNLKGEVEIVYRFDAISAERQVASGQDLNASRTAPTFCS